MVAKSVMYPWQIPLSIRGKFRYVNNLIWRNPSSIRGKFRKYPCQIPYGIRKKGCMFAGKIRYVSVAKSVSNGVIVAKKPFFMKPTHC